MKRKDQRSTSILSRAFFGSLPLLLLASTTFGLTIDVADSPTSNLALTLKIIGSAKKTLYMNAYELTSAEIADALIKQVKAGIKVEVLQEGEPCCAKVISEQGLKMQAKIVKAMNASGAKHRYYLMSSQEKSAKRRFNFNHAKYIVADEERLLVGSENFTPTGNPNPQKDDGNRGWQIMVHDSAMAKSFIKLFKNDSDPSNEDIEELAGSFQAFDLAPSVAQWTDALTTTALHPVLAAWAESNKPISLDADRAEQITSPNTSLNGLLSFIKGAKKTLDLELMSFNPRWGTTGDDSPMILEIVKAARRGVAVRVLLNDETVFGGSPSDKGVNIRTMEYLKSAAKKEKLDIKAMICDVDAMGVTYIHNKGALSDGTKTLVSSINWNQNSVEKNREAAIMITSTDINKHYSDLFENDWQASKGN